jgi:hypothetical protein
MVESKKVEAVMVQLAGSLSSYAKETDEGRKESRRLAASQDAYRLAHAIRDDLDSIWQKKD